MTLTGILEIPITEDTFPEGLCFPGKQTGSHCIGGLNGV